MGYISTTVLTTFTLLISYSFLVSVVQAELPTGEVGSQQIASETLHKRRPVATWIKTLPIRRLKQFSAYKPTDIEFIDDLGNIDKRFDDYGHMRFGKRGGGEDGFDDYGHMRFGR